MGVGNWIAGSAHVAQRSAGCSSSILAMATISPGPASSTACVSAACTASSGPILTGLRALLAATTSSRLSVPEKTRMKLSFCTNGSMRVLKTWATSGPVGIGFHFDLLHRPCVAVRVPRLRATVRTWRRRRAIRSGRRPSCPNSRRSGPSVPFGHGPDDQPRQFFIGRRCSLEVPLHHPFVHLDDRLEQRLVDLAGIDQRPAGIGRHVQRADHAFESRLRARRARSAARRTCPTVPGSHSTSAGKSMFSASILLMTIMRPRPALPASSNTRRVLTSMPDLALITMAAVSTPCMAPIVWPMKSG